MNPRFLRITSIVLLVVDAIMALASVVVASRWAWAGAILRSFQEPFRIPVDRG